MKRIPTLLGLGLVLVLVAVMAMTVSSVKNITNLGSKAEVVTPQAAGITIANITDDSLTLIWSTTQEVSGVVTYGQTKDLEKGAVGENKQTKLHFVRLFSLSPETTYYLRPAGTEGLLVTTTAAKLTGNGSNEPLFSRVVDGNGEGLAGAVVIWEASGSGKIATLSKTNGDFVLPLGLISVTLPRGTPEKISVMGEEGTAAVMTCQVGSDQPLPPIKIGENSDCQTKEPVFSPGPVSFEVTPSPLPTISGKAMPNQMIKILVRSEIPYTGIVKAGPDGSWSWTPPASLTPGTHTATVTIINSDGTTQTATKTFVVTAGSSLLPITSGTPSAQPAPPLPPPPRPIPAPAPVATVSPAPLKPPVAGRGEETGWTLMLGGLLIVFGAGVWRLTAGR